MGNDGMGEGPKKSRDAGVAAGFNRKGKPNVEKLRTETPPNPFAEMARDIKKSVAGKEMDTQELLRERSALSVASSTEELERMLKNISESTETRDKEPEFALAVAEEYEKRLQQEERNDLEPDF